MKCTELPAVGGVKPHYDFRVIDPLNYVTGTEVFISILELFFVMLVCAYILEEATEIIDEGRQYWTSIWNFIDIINLLVFIIVIFIRIFSDVAGAELVHEMKSDAIRFIDFQVRSWSHCATHDEESNLLLYGS